MNCFGWIGTYNIVSSLIVQFTSILFELLHYMLIV